MKLNFLNVDTPGEAELALITCSGEPEHPFLSLKTQRCVGWFSLHSCAELWHGWCCGVREEDLPSGKQSRSRRRCLEVALCGKPPHLLQGHVPVPSSGLNTSHVYPSAEKEREKG